ncbi:hypothetical protein BURK1_03172 [Burkholderiales bacterium]|nr:hypothetical protein BURK1_03172 [Burkholderiales bacterium]
MKPVRTVVALLLAGFAGPALGDQVVTLRVPVHLQNLHPEVAKLSVGCYITPAGAFSRTDLPVVNRAFDGTVDVKVAVTDAQSLSATGYKCSLYLFPAAGPGWTPTQAPGAYPPTQAKAGTPFKIVAEGPLPPAGGSAAVPSPISSGASMPRRAVPAWGALGSGATPGQSPTVPAAPATRGSLPSSLPPPAQGRQAP